MYRLYENTTVKKLRSSGYNYNFDKQTGFFVRWGETLNDDPTLSPFGPEIADIEISTTCFNGCPFCYKGNTGTGESMGLETFKKVFSAFPNTLTQIAFGIGDVSHATDIWEIFEYTREHGIIPNVTINGNVSDTDIKKLVELCGAVAVSLYNKDVCYDAVKRLTAAGLKQTNIHCLVSKERLPVCFDLIKDARKTGDPRLAKLNASVFLIQKPKGRATENGLTEKDFQDLISVAENSSASIGFDSCSATMFLKAMGGESSPNHIKAMVEPCESMLFSIYVDVRGNVFPCSFLSPQYPLGNIIGLTPIAFLDRIWKSESAGLWRSRLEKSCRSCPEYTLCKAA